MRWGTVAGVASGGSDSAAPAERTRAMRQLGRDPFARTANLIETLPSVEDAAAA
jgi:hypothetical protein